MAISYEFFSTKMKSKMEKSAFFLFWLLYKIKKGRRRRPSAGAKTSVKQYVAWFITVTKKSVKKQLKVAEKETAW